MGLDMYLTGDRFLHTDWKEPKNNTYVGGFRRKGELYELGYWRKHSDLHGYIVATFAEGVDECQQIDLNLEDLEQIIKAVKGEDLPETKGFFFGESETANDQDTIKQIEGAIKWLKKKDKKGWRSVIYRASW